TAGYATGITGKWGLAEPGTAGTPTRRGFDEWIGYLNQNHAAYYYTDHLDENDGIRELPENRQGRRGLYSNDLMADFAVSFVQRHREQPFFLYLSFTLPHNKMEVPDLGEYAARTDWPEDARIYAAMVTRLDRYVGRLLAELKRLGLDESTVVFFASDNGPVTAPRSELLRSAGAWRGRKGSLHEGGLRVPMIVRWPGRVPAGRVSAEPWSFADIAPTLLELAGRSVPSGLDGRSVVPVLTGAVASLGDRPLYWESPRDRLVQAARLGRWKAMRTGLDGAIELYDLVADPTESTDVAARHPDTVASLRTILDSSHIPSPHWPVR
ncbi:MAG: sulfatase-like hydrolase/transferase, partial [Opitutaceae bacterium]|nr:sulfatase-like hydrolase/transferase [Opitutaceae bacterium]